VTVFTRPAFGPRLFAEVQTPVRGGSACNASRFAAAVPRRLPRCRSVFAMSGAELGEHAAIREQPLAVERAWMGKTSPATDFVTKDMTSLYGIIPLETLIYSDRALNDD
jgi:hypothetical protein